MSDLVERLRAEHKRITDSIGHLVDGPLVTFHSESADYVESLEARLTIVENDKTILEARLAAAELNAARYEWLRLHLSDDSGVNTKEGWMPIAYEGPEGTDAAIDAARGKP